MKRLPQPVCPWCGSDFREKRSNAAPICPDCDTHLRNAAHVPIRQTRPRSLRPGSSVAAPLLHENAPPGQTARGLRQLADLALNFGAVRLEC